MSEGAKKSNHAPDVMSLNLKTLDFPPRTDLLESTPSWGRLRCRLGILDKIAASCPLNAMTLGCRSGAREGCSESTWPAPQGSDGDGEVGLVSWVFANRCAPNQNPQGLFMAREPLEQSG